MKSAIVVDTSIVIKWVLDEPDSTTALALLTKWINEGTAIYAPALLIYEVANALYQRVRKAEMTAGEAQQALVDVLFPELVFNFSEYSSLSMRAIKLAEQSGLPPTYDTHYLALAKRNQGDNWTPTTHVCNAIPHKPTLPPPSV